MVRDPAKPASSSRVAAALAFASEAARSSWAPVQTDARTRTRRHAIGDPQAPIEAFLAVLDHHGLLDDDGRLAPDVLLVSIGDHFDWGGPDERDQSARSGLELLSWLAAHPPDQTILILGNHDLGRVGELVDFTDDEFALAHERARAAYRDGAPDPMLEGDFLARYPALPSAEIAARDFAAFCVAQRELVTDLLRAGRFTPAWAASKHELLMHAGVTTDDLDGLGLDSSRHADAPAVAEAVSAAVASAIAGWRGGPLTIPGLHQPGDADGEGGGIFYHRAAHPDRYTGGFSGARRRRFDPRRLPIGLTQVIGHVSDRKARELLGPWSDEAEPRTGVLRHLRSDAESVAYRHGLPAEDDPTKATLIYIDGQMKACPAPAYELFDLTAPGRSLP